jgi:glycosyltransferase involved in cell wall biosynthesis
MAEDEGIPRERIEIIPHGCDLPEKTLPPPHEFTVGTLGMNAPDKGQSYLVNAIVGLWRTDGGGRARYPFVSLGGVGTGSWVKAVSGLSPFPKFTAKDWINDLGLFYSGLSVYIQPSVTEGFGIPALEAMSYGRPVIVTEGVGCKDLVQDGVNGFIVPIRDIKAIAEKIAYFSDNPEEVRRMGKNARETAEKNQWGDIEKRYEELYRRVLGE